MLQHSKLTIIRMALLLSLVISPILLANPVEKTTVENFSAQIASHKGEVVYIDFWASWCGPCRKSFPWMNHMQTTYKSQGLKVISINLDNDKVLAEEFLANYPADFDVVYDPKGVLAQHFKLKGMPNSFIINKKGKLVSAHVGFTKKKQIEYEKEILELLAINDKS